MSQPGDWIPVGVTDSDVKLAEKMRERDSRLYSANYKDFTTPDVERIGYVGEIAFNRWKPEATWHREGDPRLLPDFTLNDQTIDCKTNLRKSKPWDASYDQGVRVEQTRKKKSDLFFMSCFVKKSMTVWLLGHITYEKFMKESALVLKGAPLHPYGCPTADPCPHPAHSDVRNVIIEELSKPWGEKKIARGVKKAGFDKKGNLLFSAPRQPGFVDWRIHNRCPRCGDVYRVGALDDHILKRHTPRAVK